MMFIRPAFTVAQQTTTTWRLVACGGLGEILEHVLYRMANEKLLPHLCPKECGGNISNL